MKGSSLQWSFSNSTASQLLSFKTAQEQQGGSRRLYPQRFPQRNLPLDKQGGSQYPITSHHWHHTDVLPANYPSDSRVFPATGQTSQMVPSGLSTAILASHLSPNGSNLATSTLGGASPMSAIKPPNGPIVGSTDLRSSPSISSGPCQLTIFYNGSVCVYDNVSPDKAQAIMLLAGNGDSIKPTPVAAAPTSVTKMQLPVSRLPLHESPLPTQQPLRLPGNDTTAPNQPPLPRVTSNDAIVALPTTGLRSQSNDIDMADQPQALRFQVKDITVPNKSVGFSSSASLHTPVTSVPVVSSSSAIEVNTVKPVVAPSQTKCSEPIKAGAPVGAGGQKLIPSAVPQARKASLARFLEKRKERVVAASPYVVSNNSSEYTTVGPGSTITVKSAGSSPLPANG